MLIQVENLVQNDYNPRKYYNKQKLKNLCDSIEKFGLIQPLAVRELETGKYEVIAGSRRFKCIKKLGIEEVECNLLDVSKSQAMDIAFAENLQREDLSPIEEGHTYFLMIREKLVGQFIDKIGGTDKLNLPQYKSELEKQEAEISAFSARNKYVIGVAKAHSISPDTIAKRLHLLNLPEDIQKLVHAGKLNVDAAHELSRLRGIEDEESRLKEMRDGAQKCMSGYIKSVSQARQWVNVMRDRYQVEETLSEEAKQKIIKELEERIEELECDIARQETIMSQDFTEASSMLVNGFEFPKPDSFGYDQLVKGKEYLEKKEKEARFDYHIHSVDEDLVDLEILQERIDKEGLHNCPYCMSDIDTENLRSEIDRLSKIKSDLKKEQESLRYGIRQISKAIGTADWILESVDKKESEIKQDRERIKKLSEK